jgi:hypothetical protein
LRPSLQGASSRRNLLDRRQQQADEDGDDGDHDQVAMHFQISFACPSWRPYGRAAGSSVWTVTSDGEHTLATRQARSGFAISRSSG